MSTTSRRSPKKSHDAPAKERAASRSPGRPKKEFSAVGVRYDVNANIAVKVDYTHYKSTILDGSDADLVAAGVVFTY